MNDQANDPAIKTQVLKSQAVRQATIEVLSENRDEILRRARAKLIAMGVDLKDEEELSP